MLRWKHIEISGGFLLLLSFLYYLEGGELLFPAMAACILHELGHFLMICLLGGQVTRLRLSCVGAEMHLSDRNSLSPGRDLAAALAGPATNLILAFAAARLAPAGGGEHWYLFAGLSLTLACFNLLPAPRLDGGRALTDALCVFGAEAWARPAAYGLSVITGGLLLGFGALLMRRGRPNLTLMLVGLWLLLPERREKTARKSKKRLASGWKT